MSELKEIIIIFDSNIHKQENLEDPIKDLPISKIEWVDLNAKLNKDRKKATSLLYQFGTDKTPLYLFKDVENDKIYNSHYFEHGPLKKSVATKKLKNE